MILCVGTTPTVQRTMVFDRLAVDEVNRAAEVTEYSSGKAINVARVLTQIGEVALAAGFLGGRRGDFLEEDLKGWRIPTENVRVTGQTRLCTTLIDRAANTVTELVEEAPPASADEWSELLARIEAHLPRAKCMVFSGTQAAGGPEDLCDRWAGRGVPIIVDARGPALRRALRTPGCVVKVNRSELAAALDVPGGSDDDAAAMLAHAPPGGLLVVTLGKAGAIAGDGKTIWRAPAPAVQAVNPIGSGDAFAAGMAAAIARGESVEEQLRLATACAVANALTPLAGTVRPGDVDRLLREIAVTRLTP
jgi:tagatose 6-phosphate kinase